MVIPSISDRIYDYDLMIPTSQDQGRVTIFAKMYLLSRQIITVIPGSVPTISCRGCLNCVMSSGVTTPCHNLSISQITSDITH